MEEVDEVVEAFSLFIAAVQIARRRVRRRKRRTVWIKSWIATRKTLGAFHCLLKDLKNDPEHFLNYLRLNLDTFEQLVEKLHPLLKKKDTCMRDAISPSEQLAVTLRFLATGESYTSLQYQFRINKGTLSLIIPKVCKALSIVLRDVVSCPRTANEWLEISRLFHWRLQLPNCLGAIDGKHVRILHPPNSGSDYFNYKGYYSLVLMAVVGPNSEFIFADVGCQGRISDRGVLRNTIFYKALQSNKLNIPESKPLPATESMIVDGWCPVLPHFFVEKCS
ncbi:protein ANTAGONIST OF LIKE HETEROCHROMATIN PROTEIN 1-like [Dendronephthya gigantea]|uniref:protein ANTAGONIST OF LIKE HETEROCHROMATIN PROTEIN 1-like n=1 Tax=Dendronephthya gigantea TaxID=151771 RepID=UPI001069954E|nr:protein ANTAGONIST OF LIKE HETEROCHROMATIN PROTEIN 1-like [Dendronephthya gigantea]XP_028398827.1 protein ANTAGONIST OF LIKE HETEROCHROMATIN PROTEIN 1-like [Dendronephthya gigantea]